MRDTGSQYVDSPLLSITMIRTQILVVDSSPLNVCRGLSVVSLIQTLCGVNGSGVYWCT